MASLPCSSSDFFLSAAGPSCSDEFLPGRFLLCSAVWHLGGSAHGVKISSATGVRANVCPLGLGKSTKDPGPLVAGGAGLVGQLQRVGEWHCGVFESYLSFFYFRPLDGTLADRLILWNSSALYPAIPSLNDVLLSSEMIESSLYSSGFRNTCSILLINAAIPTAGSFFMDSMMLWSLSISAISLGLLLVVPFRRVEIRMSVSPSILGIMLMVGAE